MSRETIQANFLMQQKASPGTVSELLPLVVRKDIPHPHWDEVAWQHTDFLSLYIVQRGRGTHVIDGIAFEIVRGDVYAMTLGQTHYLAHCQQLVMETLHFRPSVLTDEEWQVIGQPQAGRWLHTTPTVHETISEMLSELKQAWNQHSSLSAVLTRALFIRLLIRLGRLRDNAEPTCAPLPSEPIIAAAIRHFDAHFTEPLRIEQIARAVFLSPDHFTEIFTRVMGRTPSDYLRHLRIERAKALLHSTDESIARVGLRAGFSDPAYFTRAFRRATGQTPKHWRKDAQHPSD
jgi:AraC-like DNA-binding protein/mannose-6-phosphate isomerase-like protein (cupin superfamily)